MEFVLLLKVERVVKALSGTSNGRLPLTEQATFLRLLSKPGGPTLGIEGRGRAAPSSTGLLFAHDSGRWRAAV